MRFSSRSLKSKRKQCVSNSSSERYIGAKVVLLLKACMSATRFDSSPSSLFETLLTWLQYRDNNFGTCDVDNNFEAWYVLSTTVAN